MSTRGDQHVSAPSVCSACGAVGIDGARPVGPNQIDKFRFCPRCGERSDHALAEGQLEVESDWFVTVELPRELGALQLVAIRASHPEFRERSLATVRLHLADRSSATLGPYLQPQVAAAQRDRLRAAGLTAEVFGRAT
jgi:hypothetical protein